LHISFGKGFLDTVPRGREMSFEQFVKACRSHTYSGSLSFAEYSVVGKLERGRDKDSTWFIPAVFVRPERRADAVGSLTGFVCDFDDGVIGRAEIESRLAPSRFVAWTSYSHGVGGLQRWRCFIPYSRPITPKEHKAHYEYFNEIFEGHLDPRCATTSQLWYLPGHPRDAPAHEIFALVDGPYFVLPNVEPSRPVARAGIAGQSPVSILAAGVAANAELSARSPPSLRDIASALASLDTAVYGDYSKWLEIGMALFDGTEGSARGCDLYDAWSRRCPNYMEGAAQAKWQSFGRSGSGPRITIATLFKQAIEAGWSGSVVDPAVQPPVPVAAPAASVPARQPAENPQPSQPALLQPTQLVLPLAVPVPMPDSWRNNPKEWNIQKLFDDGETREWKTVIRGVHLLSLEFLSSVGEEQYSIELKCQNAGKTPIVTLSAGEATDTRGFRSLLAQNGIVTSNANEFKEFQEMIMDWLKKIQASSRVKQSFTHLGWMEKQGQILGFAHGDSAYFPDGRIEHGIKVATGGGSTIAKHYYPAGDLAKWKATTKFLADQGRPELMTILSTAFGSPLMKFSGHSGAVVSIVSTASGVGKSTALSLAQSVWGSPKSAIHAANDTAASLSSKMGFTKDLPAYWDDLKGENTFRQFAETIYQITQGKEKSRLTQQSNLREVETWNCLAVVAANDSIIEIVKRYGRGTDAGAARIFEIILEDRPANTQQATFFDTCTANYGRAGEVYASWLAVNHGTARATVERLSEGLSKELAVESEERFWLAAIVTMLAGAMFAKQLNLVDFNLPVLKSYLVRRFRELRGGKTAMIADQGPGPVISNMVLDYQSTTLRIEDLAKSAKQGVKINHAPKLGSVDILIIEKGRSLRIRKAKFNEWCRNRNESPDTLYKRLQQASAITERNTDPMGGAAPYSQGMRTSCYDIDLKKLGISGDQDDSGSGG